MYLRPDQSFFFILAEIHDLLPALYVFSPSRFMEYISIMILKTGFRHITIQK